MNKNPYAPEFNDLPEVLSIFPLSGVLLLPTGQLPLNIFEPRYKVMVEDALAGDKMIGMIQPSKGETESAALYDVGCMGKITEYSETTDGRYLISLTGVCRFSVEQELSVNTPYRQVRPGWGNFRDDIERRDCRGLDRSKLHMMLKTYFDACEMNCDWDAVESANDARLITCLSMVCPFSDKEKQALLEASCINERAKTFMMMLEMAVHECRGIENPCESKH